MTFQVHAPPPAPGNPVPPLPSLPFHFFSISPFDEAPYDGHAHIMWRDPSGQTFEVYDAIDFDSQNFPPLWQVDVTDASQTVTHRVYTHLLELPFLPHYPSLTPASLPPEAQATYQILLDSLPQLFQSVATMNGSSSMNTGLSGVPGASAYYRVRLDYPDSDDDGLPNEIEIQRGLNPYNPDTDEDGVTDPWDYANFTGPIISEFMANSGDTLLDENGEIHDWVEIFNPTDQLVDLNGWFLSDRPNEPGKWQFPFSPPGQDPAHDPLVLDPGESVIIFLSGNTRRPVDGLVHADLKLNEDGESIVLTKPARQDPNDDESPFDYSLPDPNGPVDEHLMFPVQRLNTSAGWALDPRTHTIQRLRFMFEATPGTLNTPSPCDILTPAPIVSPVGGIQAPGTPAFPITLGPAPGSPPTTQIHYTLDGSNPTQDSPRYFPPSGNDPGTQLFADGNTIVRAVALEPDCVPSPIVARSYLFTDSILGTAPQGTLPTDAQVRPPGYPGDAIGLSQGDKTVLGSLDFDLDPEVIRDHRDTLVQELQALPSISITCPVEDLFGIDHGIYSNSSNTKNDSLDPLDNRWRRVVSMEYLDPNNPTSENAELLITGDTSRSFSATDKHSLRLRFRSRLSLEGENALFFDFPIFQASNTIGFRQLNLRHPTHDSYTLKWNAPDTAAYIRSSFAQELHARMGLATGFERHPKVAHRWVHLFLNGLHWGIYDLTERVDEDFARTYDSSSSDYDVLSYSGDPSLPTDHDGIIDGNYHAWDALRTLCVNAAANPVGYAAAAGQTEWLAVLQFLDLHNYIDYLIVSMYLNHRDWPSKNFRVMRRRGRDEVLDPINQPFFNPGGQFQFLVWDAESTLRSTLPLKDRVLAIVEFDGDDPNTTKVETIQTELGVAEFHYRLRNHPAYQEIFRQRVARHSTTPGGLLTPDSTTGEIPGFTFLQDEMNAFAGTFDSNGQPLTHGGLFTESARWGDSRKSVTNTTYTYSNPSYRPDLQNSGDWKRNTDFYLSFDSTRRTTFLNLLRSLNLADPE